MSKIILSLEETTYNLISSIAKEHDATITEVAQHLLIKGLAYQMDRSADHTHHSPTEDLHMIGLAKQTEIR